MTTALDTGVGIIRQTGGRAGHAHKRLLGRQTEDGAEGTERAIGGGLDLTLSLPCVWMYYVMMVAGDDSAMTGRPCSCGKGRILGSCVFNFEIVHGQARYACSIFAFDVTVLDFLL